MTTKFPIQRFTVHRNSMLPTLKSGQDVLVWCWFFRLKVGDLVVFEKDGKEMIKRVQKLNDRCIFVIGDNLDKSTDSRHFGWIDKSEITGKVIVIF